MHSAATLRAFEATLRSLLAPLRPFLEDPAVTEILVNAADRIYVERRGTLERTDARFSGPEHLAAACRNLAQYVEKRFVEEGCRIDGRLPDGSRVHILHGPAAGGTLLSIRRFGVRSLGLDDLVGLGALTGEAAEYLCGVVAIEKHVFISGATGVGKTTVLAALAALLPEHLRILVLEDARELQIDRPHVVHLEVRPAVDGIEGAVTMRDLVHSALRLRGDRLILGEVRGPEALDLLAALTSGHGGSLTTVHASSPDAVVSRLETLALLALPGMSSQALRRQVCGAANVVVQLTRTTEGRRRVSSISEIDGVAPDGSPAVNPVFDIAVEGGDAGELAWTGHPSRYRDDCIRAGYRPPASCRPLR